MYVDVKKVKRTLWDVISGGEERLLQPQSGDPDWGWMESLPPPPGSGKSWRRVISMATQRLQASNDAENVSPAICFICTLHLCNENNLALERPLPALPPGREEEEETEEKETDDEA